MLDERGSVGAGKRWLRRGSVAGGSGARYVEDQKERAYLRGLWGGETDWKIAFRYCELVALERGDGGLNLREDGAP